MWQHAGARIEIVEQRIVQNVATIRGIQIGVALHLHSKECMLGAILEQRTKVRIVGLREAFECLLDALTNNINVLPIVICQSINQSVTRATRNCTHVLTHSHTGGTVVDESIPRYSSARMYSRLRKWLYKGC
jgi:hypothetical protein